MTPAAQKALINSGRYLRMLAADSDEALRLARLEATRHAQRSAELRDSLEEIEAALAEIGVVLPAVTVTKAA